VLLAAIAAVMLPSTPLAAGVVLVTGCVATLVTNVLAARRR